MVKKFICTVCGYVHEGEEAPEKCPLCGAPRSKFEELDETAALTFVTEHKIGEAKGCDEEMIKDLTAHFNGECSEVGMYLAMSRQADREGLSRNRRGIQALRLRGGRACFEVCRTAGRVRMGYQDQP